MSLSSLSSNYGKIYFFHPKLNFLFFLFFFLVFCVFCQLLSSSEYTFIKIEINKMKKNKIETDELVNKNVFDKLKHSFLNI